MNDSMKNIINKRKEQLQLKRKYIVEDIEQIKDSLVKTEKELEEVESELSDLQDEATETEARREAAVRGGMGVVRFECTDEQFKSIQLQLNSNEDYVHLPGNITILRTDVSILQYTKQ